MSECVVRMEMPENCCECQLRQEDYEMGEEFCPFTGVECLSIGRQNNCPIIYSLPEGHGRLGDLDKLEGVVNMARIRVMRNGEDTNPYWECADLILQAPTIVPAERSET